ncbi:MAG: hypothetical protein V4616_08275 [Bacteroidota bacterium]
MMNKLSTIILAGSLVIPFAVSAQTDPKKTPQEEQNTPSMSTTVVTVGSRDIKLRDAYRITAQPSLFDTTITKTGVRYEIRNAFAKTKYEVQPIQAANLRIVEPLTRLYRVYARAGVGMYTSPIGDLYINSLRSRKGGYGISYNHYSSAGGVKNVLSNGAFSTNKAQLWGKTFVGKNGLSGNFNYQRDVNHFYGYNPDRAVLVGENALSMDSIRQQFQYLGGGVKFESYNDDLTKLNHSEEVSYYGFSKDGAGNEQNIKANLGFTKMVNKELLGLKLGLDNNTFKTGDSANTSYTNTIFNFSPQISTNGEKYKLKLGLAVVGQFDSTSKFYFFPDAEFSYYLVDNVLMPYAGLGGGVNRNSYRSSFMKNPFLVDAPDLRNTVEKFRVYIGLRGNFSAGSSFNLQVAQSSLSNMQLFVNDTAGLQNTFQAVYDNSAVTSITGEVSFHQSQKFQLTIRGEYFSYNMATEQRALNLPNAKGTVTGKYNVMDKLYVTADFFVQSNRFARIQSLTDPSGYELVNIDKVIDLNLGFEYRYTKRLSAFINFNNLASQKYQRYYGYRVQPINVFGGLTFAF